MRTRQLRTVPRTPAALDAVLRDRRPAGAGALRGRGLAPPGRRGGRRVPRRQTAPPRDERRPYDHTPRPRDSAALPLASAHTTVTRARPPRPRGHANRLASLARDPSPLAHAFALGPLLCSAGLATPLAPPRLTLTRARRSSAARSQSQRDVHHDLDGLRAATDASGGGRLFERRLKVDGTRLQALLGLTNRGACVALDFERAERLVHVHLHELVSHLLGLLEHL